MNVLFLTPRFYPDIGGVETHVLEIGKELIKKNHTVSLITEQNSARNNESPATNIFGINIMRLDFGKDDKLKKIRIWSKLWKLRNYIKSFDIIHCHDVFIWYLPLKIIYPGKKVFVTFHGYEGVFPPKKMALILRKVTELLCAGNICVGDYIHKWYGTKPTYITYGGLNITSNNNYDNNNKKVLKIVLVGRLEKDIGVETYLKVLDDLKKRKVKFDLQILGEGAFRKKLEKYGRVYGFTKDIGKFMNKTDVIFASSYLSMLEALFRKKIVISVFENPLKEDYLKLSPFSSYIYICKDSKEVVSVIESIVVAPWKSSAMIENGYEWAKKQTWDEVCRYYLKLWNL